MAPRWVLVIGVAGVLPLTGCSGSGDDGAPRTGGSTPAGSVPVTAAAPTSPPPTTAPAVPPWFELATDGAEPAGPVQTTVWRAGDPPAPNGSYRMAWAALTGAQDGLIFADVRIAQPYPGPEGDYVTEELPDVPEGQAWLLTPHHPAGAPGDFGYEIHWRRANGDLWMFRSSGLSADRFVDLALQAVPGVEVPVDIPEPSLQVLDVAAEGAGVVRQQEYSFADGRVYLTVRNDGGAFDLLVLGPVIEPVTVAGTPGYEATLTNGQVELVWDAGNGWWATASISPTIAAQADEIIGSIVPTPG
jgi:hypothetical protein